MKEIDIDSLIRPHIKKLKPYSSARDEFSGEAKVFLNANENCLGSPIEDSHIRELNRYPDSHFAKLIARLAETKSVSPESIMIGNGSDELIDLIIRLFCTPEKDTVITTPPVFKMYEIAAEISGVEVVKVPLKRENFELDLPSLLAAITSNTKIVFLCSPNNPTGNLVNYSDILTVLDNFNGIVVVDEAYIDFAEQRSFIEELKNYENLIVLQTFSKAYGLAGIRVGAAYAASKIINYLFKIKAPYNVNAVSQEIALKALESGTNFISETIKSNKVERARLINALKDISCVKEVYPSDANFILVRFSSAKEIYEKLAKAKIITRAQSSQLFCEECIRITVGTAEENSLLINVL